MQTEENKMVMARNIKMYMERKGVSNQQLCDDLGFKYTTFMDWIKAVTYPRIGKIEAMANYFGIQKSDLIEDKEISDKKEKTDVAVDVVIRMGSDQEFCEAVKLLDQLDAEKLSGVTAMLRSLVK